MQTKKEKMKSQLTALFVAMPLLFIAVQSHAEYVFKFPIEESSGGTLPNGSIIIVKNAAGGGVVVPPVVAEPDPLEPEIPACDPNLNEGRNANVGKEQIYPSFFYQSQNVKYSSCKLKPLNNSNLIIRFVDGISVNTGNINTDGNTCSFAINSSTTSCMYRASFLEFLFNVKRNTDSLAIIPAEVSLSKMAYQMRSNGLNPLDIKKVVINNKECTNFRIQRITSNLSYYKCDYGHNQQSLDAVTGKPFIVEVYK